MEVAGVKLPGRRGMTWIGGMAALVVGGWIEIPIAVALAAVPVVDANLNGERASTTTARTSTARTPSGTGRTAKRRTRSGGTGRRTGTARRTTTTSN